MNEGKKKIALVMGTRPEVIKMAPVYFALKESDSLAPEIVATAQHRQMLDTAMEAFGIRPDVDLNLMQQGQTLPELTGRIIVALTDAFKKSRPDAVLIQGDTTTVLGAAIAAFYERIPIGHVEAGLRTGDLYSPFPEEMNRRLTSPLAAWNFCPTSAARDNLVREGTREDRIFVTGNTVIDALKWMHARMEAAPETRDELIRACGLDPAFVAANLDAGAKRRMILVTGHRRESFGDGFEHICRAVAALVEKYPDVCVVYPVHMNPNVQEPVHRILGGNPRIALIPPVGYREFIGLMSRCRFLLSDSGGVQEEAPSLGKPVLVMRDTSERMEGVAAGTSLLVGTDSARIVAEASRLLDDEAEYNRRSCLANPYGDGKSALRIREILETAFRTSPSR